MIEWTKDGSKFSQMMTEATTAVSLWRNEGTWVKLSKIPKDKRICIFCGEAATQAEHLVNKAHGGNHTPFNVIPVCTEHKKRTSNWEEYYTDAQQAVIRANTTYDDSLRLNHYIDQNLADAAELKQLLTPIMNEWRASKGLL